MTHHSSLVAAGVIGIAVSALTGCYATAEPAPVDYAETTAAPVDIETYPSVTYLGQPVYFYGDHWWYRNGGRWTYYRNEPAELHQQREVVRARGRVHTAPPPPREVHEEHR
jgi:hypothetical protein